MRLAARVDSNQKQIVAQLRALGYHVTLLHQLGRGKPDLLVAGYDWKTGRVSLLLVELKSSPSEGLTPDEQDWHTGFRETFVTSDLPLIVASSLYEIIDWFRAID
jgi:hypothetical protein